jgi:hypothetical protein
MAKVSSIWHLLREVRELRRTPFGRSSQNSYSRHLGEERILKIEEVAEWLNAAPFFLKVLTPVSRRRGFESLPSIR